MDRTFNRIRALLPGLAICAPALMLCTAGAPQHCPAQPVRLGVGFPAGDADDIIARVLAQRLGAPPTNNETPYA